MSCTCPAGCNAAFRSLPSLRPTGTDVLASVQTRSDAASSLRLRSIKALILWEAHLLHRRCFHGDISLLGSTCIMPSHTRDSHGRSPAFRSVPPNRHPTRTSTPSPPPPHLRCRSHAAGFVCVLVASYYTPQHPASAAWGRGRGVLSPGALFLSPLCIVFFFFSLTAAEQRSCNNSLKDTWSCGLFMQGCRMWDSASGKKLRNPPVYTTSLPPHCTIGGCFPRTSFTLSNLCRR